jgi:hypothetical protein
MSGGILPDLPPRLELVDDDFVPSPPPGSSLYGQPTPIPLAEYMQWLREHDQIGRAAAEVPAGTAPEAAPTASAPPPDDDGGGTAA